MKIYYVGVMNNEPYEQEIVEEEKYFMKKESALKYREKLENDENGWIKGSNNFETFFSDIEVIED